MSEGVISEAYTYPVGSAAQLDRGSHADPTCIARMYNGAQSGTSIAELGQLTAGRLVVPRWLPLSLFKHSDTLNRCFATDGHTGHITDCGVRIDASEPILCYIAPLKNPPRSRSITDKTEASVSVSLSATEMSGCLDSRWDPLSPLEKKNEG